MGAILDLKPASLGSLSSDEAVQFFARLLWGTAHRRGLPLDAITITSRVNVPDGGIDADIRPNAVVSSHDLLAAGNSFFQIKAGEAATPWQKGWLERELLGTKRGSASPALGTSVLECLRQKGRYVLVCFGCDPTGAQRRAAIKHIKGIFAASGFARARVDVWGQSMLASLAEVFPSLTLRLSDSHHLPFLTIDEWRRDASMSVRVHFGKEREELIAQVRSDLRGRVIHHVRLVGEPGLGKTKLVLEALSKPDLAASVVYVRNPEDFENSPLFNVLLRADNQSSVILVVDDCPPKSRASIWNALRERSDRVQVVTLDHGPETSRDELMQVLECPALNREQIKAILADYTDSRDLDRWTEFCSGSPRVAHAVGANLRNNPEDILKPVATVPVWDRFVHGNTRAGTHEEAQHEVVLRYLSLFNKFGFEPPVEDEAKFIAGLVAQADPAITWPRFQSIIKHFRDRRILQGKTTLFLVPRALHIHLWLQFWEHYGSGVDVRELLDRMPTSLLRWFAEMFKFGHASPRCSERIEHLVATGGPFDNRDFITNGKGAEFLNDLAEAHPEATLRCLERTVGQWSHDDLLEFSNSRQYAVWALEKIAIWKDYFHRAAMVLLKLARTENSSFSNNATGTFCELFEMGFDRFAASEAPPEMRLPTLREALAAADAGTRAIAIKALRRALDDHPHSKMVGPEHQGMRPLPKLWSPRTWKEVHDVYGAWLSLAMEFWESHEGDERAAVIDAILQSAFHLLRRPVVERDTVAALQRIAADSGTDLRTLVQHLSQWRQRRWRGLNRSTAGALRAIEKSIEGSSLSGQIVRTVLLGNWADIDRNGGEYGKAHTGKLRGLARKAIGKPEVLQELLPRLSTEPGFAQPAFGFALGDMDEGFTWLAVLVEAFEQAGSGRNPELLTGYLSGMFGRDRQRWESTVSELLNSSVHRQYARQLVIGSGLTPTVLDRLCESVERREIPEESLAHFPYARRRDGVTAERCLQFVAWCIRLGRPALVRIALETANVMFCFDKPPAGMPEQPVLDLLVADGAFHEADQAYHRWAEVTKRYVHEYPRHALRILESVWLRFETHDFALYLAHSQAQGVIVELIRKDPHSSWSILTRLMDSQEDRRSSNLAWWLGPGYSFAGGPTSGPLASFDVDDVLRWIDRNRDERAYLIARACPRTFDGSAGGALTRNVLIRYGDRDDVRSALWGNFSTDGWSGKASEHHREKRDRMRKWLAEETERPIIDWLQDYIDWLGRQIKESEIREEREF